MQIGGLPVTPADAEPIRLVQFDREFPVSKQQPKAAPNRIASRPGVHDTVESRDEKAGARQNGRPPKGLLIGLSQPILNQTHVFTFSSSISLRNSSGLLLSSSGIN